MACCTVTTPNNDDWTLHKSATLHHYHIIKKQDFKKTQFLTLVFKISGVKKKKKNIRHMHAYTETKLSKNHSATEHSVLSATSIVILYTMLTEHSYYLISLSLTISVIKGLLMPSVPRMQHMKFIVKKKVYSVKTSQLQEQDVQSHTPTSHTHFILYHWHTHVHVFRLWLFPGGGDFWQHT